MDKKNTSGNKKVKIIKQGRRYYIDDDGRAVCASCKGKAFITSHITKRKFYKPEKEKHWEKHSRKEITTKCGNCFGEGSKDWVEFLKDGGFVEGRSWHSWGGDWNPFGHSSMWTVSGRKIGKSTLTKKAVEKALDIKWVRVEK